MVWKKWNPNGKMKTILAAAVAVGILGQALTVPVQAASKFQEGDAVEIKRDQAITYSPKSKKNIPHSAFYPLPQGAVDVIAGARIAYKKNGNVYYYYQLQSGIRVNSDDLRRADDVPANNTISKMSIRQDKRYTYITLSSKQRVTYKVKYQADSISFTFQNTVKTPASQTFRGNAMFTKGSWSKNTLTLHFAKKNTFSGYKASYDKNGNLVLRFQNPPKTLAETRIAIDAGHGGKDKGALGSNSKYNEKDINSAIAKYLAAELKERGATVILLDTDNIQGQQRKEMAEDWGAHYLISIHCNSAANKNAAGTEVFYFHGFNKTFANQVAKEVSGNLDTNNRGGKNSYYHVTLSSQMKSVLVETGFMTNKAEYKKLIKKSYQQKIATGIADAIEKNVKLNK